MELEEVPKHKKRAIKRKPKKSKHKHNYVEVLIKGGTKNGEMITSGKKCTICSKLVYGSFITSPDESGNFKKLLTDEDSISSYYKSIGKNVEIVHVNRWGEQLQKDRMCKSGL